MVVQANTLAFRAGYNLGETAEIFESSYEIAPAEHLPGTYTNVTGNVALAWGLLAAANLAKLPLFLGSYPITPASDILHELSKHKNFGVRTLQAEDEIAGIGAALGAAFGGALGVTTTSGPGLDLKAETVGLAVSLELPLLIVDIQRGGPSTGLPTKTEQSDLLHAMFGRHGEAPVPIVAAKTPSHCFEAAIEAVRIALKYRTPVYLLSDGYLANGSEPWRLPDVESLPDISVEFATEPNATGADGAPAFWPFLRDAQTLARPWAIPGTPGLEHRIGGLEKRDGVGTVAYESENHEAMVHVRAAKIAGIARDLEPVEADDPNGDAKVLMLGWGSTYAAITAGVKRVRRAGGSVAQLHLVHLNPFPPNLARGAQGLPGRDRPREQPRAPHAPCAGGLPRRRKGDVESAGDAVRGGRDRARHLGRDRPSREGGRFVTDVAVPLTTRKDWASDQEVRWCPGCGDYTILSAVQLLLPELGVRRENTVFISGIGCAARFPYYMNTYGMHSIHGRAPAIATGLAVTRPDLDVWVVSGDGDALSIGGNHLVHALRRNVKITILMFNNQIYGLTKGQYSPTSEVGKITKSTPFGSLDTPFNPISLALGAEASFVARTHDLDRKHMVEMFRRAHDHPGASFVEVYQNCNVFNDGAFEAINGKENRADMLIPLEHGKPIRFGADGEHGVASDSQGGLRLVEVADVGEEALACPRRAAGGIRAWPLPFASRDRSARADPDRRVPGRRAPRLRQPRGPAAAEASKRQGAGRARRRSCAREPPGATTEVGLRSALQRRKAMPVRGLGWKNVASGACGALRGRHARSCDRHGPQEEAASARPVADCRGGLVPSGLVGELVLGEAVQHHLRAARVEIVLRGLLAGPGAGRGA